MRRRLPGLLAVLGLLTVLTTASWTPAVAGPSPAMTAHAAFAAEDTGGSGSGLLDELKGRFRAASIGGSDSGAISFGGVEFSDDEIAQLTYQHIGAGDIPGRPTLDEISTALEKAQPTPLEGQNAVQYEYGGVRVIVNQDAPWRSTAYYPGGG